MIPKKRVNDRIKQAEKEKLTELQLSNCSMDKLPDQLLKSKNLVSVLTTLDLSSNALSFLPEKMNRLVSLTSINLSRNKFVVFPEILCAIQSIKILRIDNNSLNQLPASIASLSQLTKFNICNNNIRRLPEEMGSLQFLEQLETTGNPLHPGYLKVMVAKLRKINQLDLTALELTVLPASIHTLSQYLQRLIITSNRLTELSKDIFSLTKLRVLDVRGNQICQIPPQISELQNLEVLGFAENLLTTVPDEISHLENLTFLNLSENRFSQIPTALFQLQNLKELFLNKNFPGIEIVPDGLNKLVNLTTLHLRGNRIYSIRVNFEKLSHLKALYISNNPLSYSAASGLLKCKSLTDIDVSDTGVSLPLERVMTALVRKRKELNLSELKMINFLPEIFLCSHVEVLYLQKNCLSELPDNLDQLQSLRCFSVFANDLEHIPPTIALCEYLEEIDISENQFSTFPDAITHCTKLRVLKIARNSIKQLPDSVKSLSGSLQEFYGSGNQLSNMQLLCSLAELRIIHINQNKIRSIPKEIENLKHLEQLFMNENELEEISPKIGKCENLICCYFQDNQLFNIPETLLSVKTLRVDGNYLSRELLQIFSKPAAEATAIDLSGMGLNELPREIAFLNALISIDLSNNSLREITHLSLLTQLEEINLSNNQIEHFSDDCFSGMSCLRDLILDENPLCLLSSSLENISTLEYLSVKKCKLIALPETSLWKNLRTLNCSNNQISSIENSLVETLPSLEHFYCCKNLFTTFPHSLFMLEGLITLQGSNNFLEFLSDEPTNNSVACKSLQTVILSNNSLLDVPVWLFEQTSLQRFEWNGNCNLPEHFINLCPHLLNRSSENLSLEVIFQSLSQVPPLIRVICDRIVRLDLCGNSLKEFPKMICDNCSALEYLNLNRNQLSVIPDTCSNLTNLIELQLVQNRIQTFPQALTRLPNLQRLFLSFNQIQSIPDILNDFATLKELHVANNRLKELPPYKKAGFLFNYRFNPISMIPSKHLMNSPASPSISPESADNSTLLSLDLDQESEAKVRRRTGNLTNFLKSPRRDDASRKRKSLDRGKLKAIRGKVSKAFGRPGNTKEDDLDSNEGFLTVSDTERRRAESTSLVRNLSSDNLSTRPFYSKLSPPVATRAHTNVPWDKFGAENTTEPSTTTDLENSKKKGKSLRVFLKLEGGNTKPVRISSNITLDELKNMITMRLNLQSEIIKMSVKNGSIEWDIEEDDDAAELVANDVITVFTKNI